MDVSEIASSDTQCVFYCCGCHEIFGDSLSIVRLNEELQSVSLQMVTDAVVVTSNCETSVEGSDSGSTFKLLNCKSCDGCIGRCYKTTPQSLDCLRDIYTLNLCKVGSYHLGSCTTSTANVLSLKEPLEILKEDIFKTQSMLLAVHERVKKLESCLEEVDSSEELVIHENNGSQKKRKTK